MNIYVIGHINPDLDSIVAAHTYAEFLKHTDRYKGMEVIPLRTDGCNRETTTVFEKFNTPLPQHIDEVKIGETDAFVLVDHNEEAQRHEKIPAEQVVEILDHHKSNLNFNTPLRIDFKPLGATSSLVYEHFKMYGYDMTKENKALILAAILSDTQGLKSSTTTGMDSQFAHEIGEELGLDLNALTFEIFRAKSDIEGLSVEELVTKDYKIFKYGEIEVFIDQIETVEPDKLLNQKDALLDTLKETKAKLGVGQAYVVITDILEVNSFALYTTEEEKRVLEKAFLAEGEDGIMDIGPRLSRKKDIAPKIEEIILSE